MKRVTIIIENGRYKQNNSLEIFNYACWNRFNACTVCSTSADVRQVSI